MAFGHNDPQDPPEEEEEVIGCGGNPIIADHDPPDSTEEEEKVIERGASPTIGRPLKSPALSPDGSLLPSSSPEAPPEPNHWLEQLPSAPEPPSPVPETAEPVGSHLNMSVAPDSPPNESLGGQSLTERGPSPSRPQSSVVECLMEDPTLHKHDPQDPPEEEEKVIACGGSPIIADQDPPDSTEEEEKVIGYGRNPIIADHDPPDSTEEEEKGFGRGASPTIPELAQRDS